MEQIVCRCGCGQMTNAFDARGRARTFGNQAHVARYAKQCHEKQVREATTKRCPHCKTRKQVNRFLIDGTGKPYGNCKACRKAIYGSENYRAKVRIRTRRYISKNRERINETARFRTAEVRALARTSHERYIIFKARTWRSKDRESDLTPEYLIELYSKQQGLCFYSNRPMLIPKAGGFRNHRWDEIKDWMTLDRLDPHKGYRQGNVVWCTHSSNLAKGYRSFHEFLEDVTLIANTLQQRADRLADFIGSNT